jgi:hypothetical protein
MAEHIPKNLFVSVRETQKIISTKNLKPGTIYIGKSDLPALFVGFISTAFLKPVWNYHNTGNSYIREFDHIESEKCKKMLWFKVNSKVNGSVEYITKKFSKYINQTHNEEKDDYSVSFYIESSHRMRKEIGSVVIPNDAVYIIRDHKRNEIIEQFIKRTSRNEEYETNVICNCSGFLNMVPHGEDPMKQIFKVREA